MSGLKMKYFVLKPCGFDPHAIASREAMLAYAYAIKKEDPQLAIELGDWVRFEMDNHDGPKDEG